jgi:hypothetical protein
MRALTIFAGHGRRLLRRGFESSVFFINYCLPRTYMWEPSAAQHDAISKVCVFMYVGENDPYMWYADMAGANAGRSFDGFEEAQKGCKQIGLAKFIEIHII